jgi:hypothetical protein
LDGENIFRYGRAFDMNISEKTSSVYVYSQEVKCYKSGKHDFAVRVRPYHKDLPDVFIPGFVKWNE